MTDAESRALVAQTIRKETIAVMRECSGDADHAEKLAEAFAKLTGRIIDHYLLYLFREPDELKGRAS